MEKFELLPNGKECHKYMLDKIKKAKEIIYISSWQVDFSYILDKETGLSLYQTLLNKCNQGVKVYVITSIAPGTKCNINNTQLLPYLNHPNLNYKILDMTGNNLFGILNLLNIIDPSNFSFKKCCKRLFHQRYFNVDNTYCMLGGVDMDEDLYCNNDQCNSNKFFWKEYGIIFSNPPKEFIEFCVNNYRTSGKSSIESPYFFGNFFEKNNEYNKILNLIDNSQESIVIENQWVNSNESTYNNIFKHLIKKILDKHSKNEKFKLIIISNIIFADICHENLLKSPYPKLICNLSTYYYRQNFYSSIKYLYNNIKKHMNDTEINNMIEIYHPNDFTLIHCKNIIIDHKYMLYGTTNIWDRSYTQGKDIELSIFLKGNKVAETEKTIFKIYDGKLNRVYLNNELNSFKYINKLKILKFIVYIIIFCIICYLVKYILTKPKTIKKNKSRLRAKSKSKFK